MTTTKKVVFTILLFINVIGILCLVRFGFLYLSHGMTVRNPDAMLPMPDWERGGLALTLGVLPLLIANISLMTAVRMATNWNPVRKLLLAVFLIPGLACAVLAGSFLILDVTGCSNAETAGTPAISVAVKEHESGAVRYLSIYTDREDSEIEKFAPDDVRIYTADPDDFRSVIAGSRIRVSLVRNLVYEGKSPFTTGENDPVPADETVTGVMQAVADSTEHDIFELSVWQDGDRYFAFYKLNVNLWTPCKLAEYDPGTGDLIELDEWDDVDLLRITTQQENS